MFLHIFKYKLLMVFRAKATLFWTAAFPLVLATFFNLAFGSLNTGETFNSMPIAAVCELSTPLETAMNESGLFEITKTTDDEAKQLLKDGAIIGYLTGNTDGTDEEVNLVVASRGTAQSVAKLFFDSYVQTTGTITELVESDPSLLTNGWVNDIKLDGDYTHEKSVEEGNGLVVFFYALLAMACIIGSTTGGENVLLIQANMSPLAARVSVVPTHKLKIFVGQMTVSVLLQFFFAVVTVLYTHFILGISFGDNLAAVILMCFVGCFTGTYMGAFITAVLPIKSENAKIGILVTITIFLSFLAGMMNFQIKYIVTKACPILAYINPANLICDGFYSLYYYDTMDRYFLNLIILAIMGVVFCGATYLVLRKQKFSNV